MKIHNSHHIYMTQLQRMKEKQIQAFWGFPSLPSIPTVHTHIHVFMHLYTQIDVYMHISTCSHIVKAFMS